ncbi:MAG: hypothetical protein KDK27_14150, partial [Leptospiraceae bacterium]|nr:hypothetical protein [Leptospiraceae bacterium]
MHRTTRIIFLSIILITLLRCDQKTTDGPSVPANFDLADAYEIIQFAQQNYFDKSAVDRHRSYVGAAEAALAALPYSLRLYTRE